ncbi:MAG: biotin--[acetyl-CoA-carboxylase] ligase [Planctomycetaceae bacterium]|nr:biotin--[acetyl-CoA-carboxylase] ligase [Planctomycetaceae bacterium]
MPEKKPLTSVDLQSLIKETFLRDILHFDETDSTNTQSLALLSTGQSIETPHLVYAETQTGGRGRGGNSWWSQPGSLTFSVIVDMSELGLIPNQQPQLSLLTGLAILKTGQSLLPRADFAVKWPNDVYLAGRKLAGILTEIPPQSNQHAVIGVGLNVNNAFQHAPEALQQTGISLADLSGQTHSRRDLLKTFLQHLDELFQALSRGEAVLKNWPEFCLLTGKNVTIQAGPNEICGICRGIDDTGALLLETDRGIERMMGGIVANWS